MSWYATDFISHVELNIINGRFQADKVDWKNCMAQTPFQQK
jgi:hypothetical protein